MTTTAYAESLTPGTVLPPGTLVRCWTGEKHVWRDRFHTGELVAGTVVDDPTGEEWGLVVLMIPKTSNET